MNRLVFLLSLVLLCGCSAFKEQTGEFVTEAVVDHIANEVDQRLAQRGLTLDQIERVADLDEDGEVNAEEVRETAKLVASDMIATYGTRLEHEQRAAWESATKNLVTRDEATGIKGDVQDFWAWLKATFGLLITSIFGYLVKQVFSAKADSKRDARLDMLEKLLHKDLDGDGLIGGQREEPVAPTA